MRFEPVVRGLCLQRDNKCSPDRFTSTSGESGLYACWRVLTNAVYFVLLVFTTQYVPMLFAGYTWHAGLVKLSGVNDILATNLKACTGECDSDSQCVYGLKCFQRQHGEPIPGCFGKGGGPFWDYCYNPSRKRSFTL